MNAAAMVSRCLEHQQGEAFFPPSDYHANEMTPGHQIFLPQSDTGRTDVIRLRPDEAYTEVPD